MTLYRESVTAKICAFSRAHHSMRKSSKIFDDNLAFDILGKKEYERIGQMIENGFKNREYNPLSAFNKQFVSEEIEKYISPITLSRAAFAEESLLQFAEKKGACQYVICGAGMDTFPFRNENRNIKIFELDYPDTQEYKLKKINELKWDIPSDVYYVPIDFSKDDMSIKLKEAGFSKDIPTFFSILGVTYYLTLSVFTKTLEMINEISSPESEIVFDYPDETTFAGKDNERVLRLRQIASGLGEIMKQGFSLNEIEEALKKSGFGIKKHLPPGEIQKTLRGRGYSQQAFENIHLIKAVKGKEFKI
ncbi:MAG: class I SAM-dependent methyltransferase [Clostridia bacterium]|nr:class I SAM-dependent methyltransferase [Clostridia bacterium]